MSKIKVELNLRGVNEVMKSPEIQAAVQAAGDAVASAASGMSGGKAFAARTHLASFVAIANVYPDSKDAAHANFKDNVIEKAVGSLGLKRSTLWSK